MLPRSLKADQFARYPAEARALVMAHLGTLQQLPLSFVPSFLREVIEYDYKFPAERAAIEREIATLAALTPPQLKEWFAGFSEFSLSSQLEEFDWVNQPAQFVEQLSAYLWTTHQLDGFRTAATEYGDRLRAAAKVEPLPTRRLGIAVIGQGVPSSDLLLFRNLREHGTYFSAVKPDNGLALLLDSVAARAKAHPGPYAHWYVDGGQAADHNPLLTCVSYQALEPVRSALLRSVEAEVERPGMGPEQLRTYLAQLSLSDLGMKAQGDKVLDRFQLRLLTEGSGTQIFSTTFAQWTTREALRRAHPLTLLVRFAPRQQQRPMNELLSNSNSNPEPDFAGSLVDADMAAYYHWINQQRLPGSEQSSFLAWFEGHREAIVVGPSMPRGSVSSSAADLGELLSWSLA